MARLESFSTASVTASALPFHSALLFVDKLLAVNFLGWSGMDGALSLKRRFFKAVNSTLSTRPSRRN